MNNIVILDPSCIRDSRSHHMNAIIGHTRTFIATGYHIILGTNSDCRIDYPGADNNPVFNYTIYDDFKSNATRYYKRLAKKPYYYFKAINTRRAIESIFQHNHIDKTDHVFIPTTDWILLQSLAKVYSRQKSVPFLHLLVMYEHGNWMTGGYPYKKIIKTLRNFNQERVFIYTETRRHAKQLENLLGFLPANYPYPAFPFDGQQFAHKSEEKIHVGALGGGRRDKGYGLLPDIINRFNETYSSHDNVIFLVQRARKEDQLDEQTRLLEGIKNVVILDNQLARQDYEKYLLGCDMAIFPYNSRVYSTRGSGIVNEAVANSIPIICSADTALTEAIICDNGKIAGSINEFALSIIDIIKNINQYKANAENAKKIFLDNLYNNPVIKDIKFLKSG